MSKISDNNIKLLRDDRLEYDVKFITIRRAKNNHWGGGLPNGTNDF